MHFNTKFWTTHPRAPTLASPASFPAPQVNVSFTHNHCVRRCNVSIIILILFSAYLFICYPFITFSSVTLLTDLLFHTFYVILRQVFAP